MMTKTGLMLVFIFAYVAYGPSGSHAQTYPPGIKYSTFLKAFNYNSENGILQIDSFEAVFLPESVYTQSGTSNMWAVIKSQGGADLYRLDFHVDKNDIAPYSTVSHYQLSAMPGAPGANGMSINLATPGKYVLDFSTPEGRFFTFPFEIMSNPSSDPFVPSLYWINGDWQDWAYFRYADADQANNLFFTLWLRNTGQPGYKLVKPKLKIFNKNGGAYVFSAQDKSVNLAPSWSDYEFTISTTQEPRPYAIVAGDLLKNDGEYVLKLFLDNQLYGEWEFTVSGGRFAPAGRTLRGQADPLTFIEGGRDEVWYRKK